MLSNRMHLLVKHVVTGDIQNVELIRREPGIVVVKWLPKGPEYEVRADGWLDSCWRLPRDTREKLFGKKNGK